jgi:sulfite oxidase
MRCPNRIGLHTRQRPTGAIRCGGGGRMAAHTCVRPWSTASRMSRTFHDPERLNSAGPLTELARAHETPMASFFTRSHAAPPDVDVATWRLRVHGLVQTPLSLSLDDLHQFPQRTVTATLLCAGLRRRELLELGPLPGELPWGPEAAATARWTGVSLRDVLQAAGVDGAAAHLEFTGLDAVVRRGETFGFGGSISVEKAADPDVLIALRMNDAPLPIQHGFPARTIVPGWIGARSVKWLHRITAATEPSANYFQTKAYRVLRVADPERPGDVTSGAPLSEIPLNAVILDPFAGQVCAAGTALTMRGWAIGTAGRAITRVEVSADDAASWQPAQLAADRDRWSWTRWSATVTVPPGEHTLVVRADDGGGVPQPVWPRDAWNVKGYLNNAWHRVRVIAR